MNIEIITNVIIPIIGAIMVYILVPYFKTKTSKTQRENIYFYVKLAVGAAEQIFDYEHAGADKKQYVIDRLLNAGVSISIDDLDVMIESAVNELNIVKAELKK